MQLPHFGHQVLAAQEAEDCDGIIFIQNPKSPENLVQGGAAGGDVVYDENVLVLNSGAEFSVGICGKLKEHFVGSERRLGKTVNVAEHILVDLTGRFGVDYQIVVVEVNLGVKVVDGFLNKVGQILVFLDGRRKFDILNELCSCFTVNFGLKLVTIIEAFAKRFHLVATASEGDKVACPIMLEVEFKLLLLYIKCYAHILPYFIM